MSNLMRQNKKHIAVWLFIFSTIMFLTACDFKKGPDNDKQAEDPYERMAAEKNAEIDLKPLTLTSYGEEVGLELTHPDYEWFAVNNEVFIQGKISEDADLKTDFVWIVVQAKEDGSAGKKLEYYAPIKNGAFEETVHFFNGEGEYRITIYIPDKKRENYYYEGTKFCVYNVNPESKRDMAYAPAGQRAGLSLDLDSSYIEEEGRFLLKGKADNLAGETVMIYLRKGEDSWKHIIPAKDGKIRYDLPLYFGEGVHELEILVPDPNKKDYYQSAITLLIDNKSGPYSEPIKYFGDLYIKRGVYLKEPDSGWFETGEPLRVAGTIDATAEFAHETTHLYITVKKGNDEALDVIPVKNFSFDATTYLRFGPGEYTITVSVPEITDENRNYFRYFSIAEFGVYSDVREDKRDLLPSRGIQSDDPAIIRLAEKITGDKTTDREKAKAIYEYVAGNIAYDVNKMNHNEFEWDDSALKTLEKKSGVCQDYAYLAIALLRASGIEARFVEGTAGSTWFGLSNARHAWVEAKIDGEWLTMDPTWGAGYLDGDTFVASYTEEYFDPNPDEFSKTHRRIGVSY